jgi:hypothetical protein
VLFPNAMGERLSVHGVQYLLSKHSASAARMCPSLKGIHGLTAVPERRAPCCPCRRRAGGRWSCRWR